MWHFVLDLFNYLSDIVGNYQFLYAFLDLNYLLDLDLSDHLHLLGLVILYDFIYLDLLDYFLPIHY